MQKFLRAQDMPSELKRCFCVSKRFRIATALMTDRGLRLIEEGLTTCLRKGGTGEVLFGTALPTEPKALRRLTSLQKKFSGRLTVKHYPQQGDGVFHPKVFLFDLRNRRKAGIIGSSNLTHGGIHSNREANVLFDTGGNVSSLEEYLDQLACASHHITSEWIAAYAALWKERISLDDRSKKLTDKISRMLPPPPHNPPPPIGMTKPHVLPTRIKGYVFAITGRLLAGTQGEIGFRIWNVGGNVEGNWETMRNVDCLVVGHFRNPKDRTRKLREARRLNIPTIDEKALLVLLSKERAPRRASGAGK